MNDPLNVVHEHPDKKVQEALRDQQKKDLDEGNCVKSPGPEYRLADNPERARCVSMAKRLAIAGLWIGRIEPKVYEFVITNDAPATDEDVTPEAAEGHPPPAKVFRVKRAEPTVDRVQGWDARVTFGHWWIKD